MQQRPDKSLSHGKRMNGRQVVDSYGSGARTRLRHHPLVPSQYRSSEPQVRGKRGCGLAVGRRGKYILGFSLKLFQGEMSYYDDMPPKRGKESQSHQVHAIEVSKREHPTLIRMGMPRRVRKQNKTLLFGNRTWHDQHREVVMAGQPTDQWVVWEGHPHQDKIR